MPKFLSYKGNFPGCLVRELDDKLFINGRVYRTSDLSELINHPTLPETNSFSAGAYNWSIRLKRGHQAKTSTPSNKPLNHPYRTLSDYDSVLCGNWNGVTNGHIKLDTDKFRIPYMVSTNPVTIDKNIETNEVFASSSSIPVGYTGNDGNGNNVFLPYGPQGTVSFYRNGDTNNNWSSSLDLYYSTAVTNTITTIADGSRSGSNSSSLHYRIKDNPNHWFFLKGWMNESYGAYLAVGMIPKTTMAYTELLTSSTAIVGAAAIGTGAGYSSCTPSYATDSAANEISSYILWRTTSSMEIHRVQIANIDTTPVVTVSKVTISGTAMTLPYPHTSTRLHAARVQLINHTDGNKYLLIVGLEPSGSDYSANTTKMYVYRITAKTAVTYVGTYTLATSPRFMQTADDNCMRFVIAYDDRYEMWSVGVGGALALSKTIMVSRANPANDYVTDPYGFDNVGRFWYLTSEAANPLVQPELAINFVAPAGQVNTINLALDRSNYVYSGTPVSGVLSVSVVDLNGALVAATVMLSPTANMSLSATTVTTTAGAVTNVPFTLTAAGDFNVDATT